MELLTKLRQVVTDHPLSRIFFVMGLIGLVVGPISIYVSYQGLVKGLDNFARAEFNDDTITQASYLDYKMSKGKYKTIQISGDQYNSYPIILTDYQSDSLIVERATISKSSNDLNFKVTYGDTTSEFAIYDKRADRTRDMLAVFFFILILTVFFPIVMSYKKLE